MTLLIEAPANLALEDSSGFAFCQDLQYSITIPVIELGMGKTDSNKYFNFSSYCDLHFLFLILNLIKLRQVIAYSPNAFKGATYSIPKLNATAECVMCPLCTFKPFNK